MRYIKSIIISSLILLMLGNSSCDESAGEPSDVSVDKTLFPLNVGNYWIYETFDLRADGSKIVESKRTDSVVIESIENIADSDAFKFSRYTDDIFTKADYYKEEFGRIYRLTQTDTFNLFFPDNIDIMTEYPIYTTIIDPRETEWAGGIGSIITTIEYLDSRFQNKQNYSSEVKSVITCEFEREETFELLGEIYKSSVYTLYPDMIIKIQNFKRFINDSVPEIDAQVLISSYSFNKKIIEYEYAENVGLVNIRHEPYQVNYYTIDDKSETTVVRDIKYFNGINRELLRFYLSPEE